MTETRALPKPSDFRIATPASWFELGLDPKTRDSDIERLVEERATRFPELKPHRKSIADILRTHARESAEAGAVYTAMMAELDDEGPLSAALAIFMVPTLTRKDGTPVTTAEELADELLKDVPRSQQSDGKRSVEVVQLAQGPAVRIRTLQEMAAAKGRTMVADAVQYFVAVPGADLTAVLSFSTPILVAGDQFAELFDAIASSFHFVWDV